MMYQNEKDNNVDLLWLHDSNDIDDYSSGHTHSHYANMNNHHMPNNLNNSVDPNIERLNIIKSFQQIHNNCKENRKQLIQRLRDEHVSYTKELDLLLSQQSKKETETIKMIKDMNEKDKQMLKDIRKEKQRIERERLLLNPKESKVIPQPKQQQIEYLPSISLFQQKCDQWIAIYEENYQNAQSSCQSISSSDLLQLKMRINKRVGQISKSLYQIESVASDISSIISSCSNDTLSILLNLLAEKWTEQAEAQVANMIPSAFFIALCMVKISQQHQAMLSIWLGKIAKSFPLMIAAKCSSNTDYSMSLHQVERMAGILSLLGAILQTDVSQSSKINSHQYHGYDLPLAWSWMVGVINTRQYWCPLTPFMLTTFLHVVGYSLAITYTQEFIKLLHCVRDAFLVQFKQEMNTKNINLTGNSKQGLIRLELYLDQALKPKFDQSISLEEPEGRKIDQV